MIESDLCVVVKCTPLKLLSNLYSPAKFCYNNVSSSCFVNGKNNKMTITIVKRQAHVSQWRGATAIKTAARKAIHRSFITFPLQSIQSVKFTLQS